MIDLSGQVAVITGGNGGIGLGFAEGVATAVTFAAGAVAFSQARHYLWGEVSGDFSTQNGGTGPGPALHTHWAYAYRAIELSNYDELDLIFLAELDLAVRTKGEIAGVENPNSGYFKTHLALGVQVNITNLVEVKTGYNIPLYRRFNGRQLVHEGAFMLMFSYLL